MFPSKFISKVKFFYWYIFELKYWKVLKFISVKIKNTEIKPSKPSKLQIYSKPVKPFKPSKPLKPS